MPMIVAAGKRAVATALRALTRAGFAYKNGGIFVGISVTHI
jgi:hypothetical protein